MSEIYIPKFGSMTCQKCRAQTWDPFCSSECLAKQEGFYIGFALGAGLICFGLAVQNFVDQLAADEWEEACRKSDEERQARYEARQEEEYRDLLVVLDTLD